MAAVDLKFFQLFARGQPGAQSKSWKTWRCKFWRLWAQKTGTETLQVAKAVGKNSKSHWVLERSWLWFQKQMTRFWTPKMLTLKNSCIWIVLRQDHPVACQKKHPLKSSLFEGSLWCIQSLWEICSPGEVNPTLYKLESAGKVLKDSTSKPRWKAVLPSSDGAFPRHGVSWWEDFFDALAAWEYLCLLFEKRKCYCDAGCSRSEFFSSGWWRVLKVDGTPNLVGRLRQFCSVFKTCLRGFKDVIVYLFDFLNQSTSLAKSNGGYD